MEDYIVQFALGAIIAYFGVKFAIELIERTGGD